MSDTTFDILGIYNHVKDHEDLVDVLPDEMGASFPVPVIPGDDVSQIRMSFFHFYVRRVDADLAAISSPQHMTTVDYSDGSIVKSYPVTSASFGVNWDDSKPVGERLRDPKLSFEEAMRDRARFFELYGQILPLYLNKNTPLNGSNKTLVKEFKPIFYDISFPPLLPYYQSMSPPFFLWLEEQTV